MKKLDLSYIETVCDGDKEMMKEFSDIFIAQVPEFIEEFDLAFSNKDVVSLGKIAHKAKSTVSIMGLTDLAKELSELEDHAHEGAFSESYIKYINNFKQECLNTVELLKSHFE